MDSNKLTEDEVNQIKTLGIVLEFEVNTLAELFDVSEELIEKFLNGYSWKEYKLNYSE